MSVDGYFWSITDICKIRGFILLPWKAQADFSAKLRAWLHTGYSVIFWSCAGGLKLVLPVNNHVDSGLV